MIFLLDSRKYWMTVLRSILCFLFPNHRQRAEETRRAISELMRSSYHLATQSITYRPWSLTWLKSAVAPGVLSDRVKRMILKLDHWKGFWRTERDGFMKSFLLPRVLNRKKREREKEKLFRSSLHADCMKGGWLIRNFTKEPSNQAQRLA